VHSPPRSAKVQVMHLFGFHSRVTTTRDAETSRSTTIRTVLEQRPSRRHGDLHNLPWHNPLSHSDDLAELDLGYGLTRPASALGLMMTRSLTG
jgi:hypothetical protein